MSVRPDWWPAYERRLVRLVGDEGPDYSRLSFNLSYQRATRDRTITSNGIDNDNIPNAWNGGRDMVPGEWASFLEDAAGDLVLHVLKAGVSEAVHEALEWAQLDSKPILNPHGRYENQIHALVGQLMEGLADLAVQAGLDEGDRRAASQ